ncbi:hypothetical protein ACMD2_00053 [Ananas comosus]|uniref:Uncharacterized protein n=1 Tax=Ananas comosus TaxID=4615 RepID=A0A199VQM5_ANACO|nr:hypothetical protein ACMD2_00053 [Ananas comosus]
MANAEPQKQLLSLIRDFATEKSRGERRVSDLRKRLVELQYDLDSANSDLASAKRAKEMVEEELQGSQAHLAMTDASMLVIEGRIYRLQEEISKVGSDLAALKVGDKESRVSLISYGFFVPFFDLTLKPLLHALVGGTCCLKREEDVQRNKQTAELEKIYASLGEELRKRYTCFGCGFNNMGELEETEN